MSFLSDMCYLPTALCLSNFTARHMLTSLPFTHTLETYYIPDIKELRVHSLKQSLIVTEALFQALGGMTVIKARRKRSPHPYRHLNVVR